MTYIRKADSIRTSDSLQKAFLVKQIEDLKTSEVGKREKLQNELKAINGKDSLARIEMAKEVQRLKQTAVGYPIVIYKDTLFTIFTKVGSLTPKERAEVISRRLNDFYDSYIEGLDSIYVSNLGASLELSYNGSILLSVTELDAMWYNEDLSIIANRYKTVIEANVVAYKNDQSWIKWIKDIGLMLLVILFQVILVKLVNRIYSKRVDPYIERQKGEVFTGFKIREYEVLDQERQVSAILTISKFFRYFINILQLYHTIPLIFSIFPPTRWIAETLFGYVLNPIKSTASSFFNYIPDLITVIVIIVITRYVVGFI